MLTQGKAWRMKVGASALAESKGRRLSHIQLFIALIAKLFHLHSSARQSCDAVQLLFHTINLCICFIDAIVDVLELYRDTEGTTGLGLGLLR